MSCLLSVLSASAMSRATGRRRAYFCVTSGQGPIALSARSARMLTIVSSVKAAGDLLSTLISEGYAMKCSLHGSAGC